MILRKKDNMRKTIILLITCMTMAMLTACDGQQVKAEMELWTETIGPVYR